MNIRKLLNSEAVNSEAVKRRHFVTKMTSTDKGPWLSSENVELFLENVKSPDWKKQVSRIVDSFLKLKCSMSFELYFMDSHMEYFPKNLGGYSEEQGVRFH